MRTLNNASADFLGLLRSRAVRSASARLRRQRRVLRPLAEDLEGRTLLSVGIDQNFGFGGVAVIPLPANTPANTYFQSFDDIALQGTQTVVDGTVTTDVTATSVSTTTLNVWRLTTSGTLDTTFGSSGTTAIPAPSGFSFDAEDYGVPIAVQSDGSIDVVTGVSPTSGTGNDELVIAQLTSSGALDTSFGTAGVELFPIPGTTFSLDEQTLYIAIGPSGKIDVGTAFSNNSTGATVFGVAQFNTNGSPDTSFNTNGFATASFTTSGSSIADDSLSNLVVESNGNVVTIGTSNLPASVTPLEGEPLDSAVAVFNANGTLDTSFNSTGTYTYNYNLGGSPDSESPNAVTINGNFIAIAGEASQIFPTPTSSTNVPSINYATLTLLNSTTGAPDTAFGPNGEFTLNFSQSGVTFNSSAEGIATLPDGSMLIGGSANQQNSYGPSGGLLADVTTAGALNTSYGTGGVAVLPYQLSEFPDPSPLLAQADGKAVFISSNGVVRTTAPPPVVASTSITSTGTGTKAAATAVTITFNTAVNPTLASNIKIYLLKGLKPRKTLKIKHVTLDSTGRNLTFSFAKTKIGKGFQVVITPGAIVAADGEVLNGGAPFTITIPPSTTTTPSAKLRK